MVSVSMDGKQRLCWQWQVSIYFTHSSSFVFFLSQMGYIVFDMRSERAWRPSFDGSWLYPGHCQMEPLARGSPLLEPGGACTGGSLAWPRTRTWCMWRGRRDRNRPSSSTPRSWLKQSKEKTRKVKHLQQCEHTETQAFFGHLKKLKQKKPQANFRKTQANHSKTHFAY